MSEENIPKEYLHFPYDLNNNILNDLGLRYNEIGLSILSNKNKNLGVVILSGGNGTRLNFSGPKGLYKINNKTLFDYHLERIENIFKKYKTNIYLFIMVNDSNYKEIESFFSNKDLGYLKGTEIFIQKNEFAYDIKTNEKLKYKGNFIMKPRGNGDVYGSIKKTKNYKNVEAFHVISVDNVLSFILDPVFVGCFYCNDYEVLSKSIKPEKNEKLGVFFYKGKKIQIREYDPEKGIDGHPYINHDALQGNICSHLFKKEFIDRIDVDILIYHDAIKKMRFENDRNGLCNDCGIKKEKFIFDSFIFTEKNGLMNVNRIKEFSPLKNSTEIKKFNELTCKDSIDKHREKDQVLPSKINK